MLQYKKYTFLLIIILGCSSLVDAQTHLPAFFGDDMVLQQDDSVLIWGTDKPNYPISITGNWGAEVNTKSDKEGKWQAKIKTLQADKKPYSLTIKGSQTKQINNILFGEVWFCSGQSNMEMPVNGYPNSPVTGSNEAILNATNKHIRLFHTRYKASLTPLDSVAGQWVEASPKTVAKFSATAYFFGKKLNDVLDIPIGLINASWGGANAEAWTDVASLKQFEDITIPTEIGSVKQHTPTALYNGMVAPFLGYGIKGAIWYQGESNRTRPEQYKKLLPAMINGWRKHWEIGDFPFYLAQVAPFHYGTGEYAPFIVEAQVHIMQNTKNTGLATTTDIGNCRDIHPSEKKLVGDRLAYWALVKDYGLEGIAYKGPVYQSMKITDDAKIKLQFEDSDRDRGLTNYGNKYDVKAFEIAGADQKFHPAKASIKGNRSIIVWNEDVKNPVAVRYAFGNCIIGTLYSTAGIPATSFRTDNWDNIGRKNDE